MASVDVINSIYTFTKGHQIMLFWLGLDNYWNLIERFKP